MQFSYCLTCFESRHHQVEGCAVWTSTSVGYRNNGTLSDLYSKSSSSVSAVTLWSFNFTRYLLTV